jgi:hypothetical protein
MPNKQPPPLHITLPRIERERVNVQKRTEARIALLYSQAKSKDSNNNQEERNWHGCVNIFCFCLLLLTMNLLFLQWLYIKMHKL